MSRVRFAHQQLPVTILLWLESRTVRYELLRQLEVMVHVRRQDGVNQELARCEKLVAGREAA